MESAPSFGFQLLKMFFSLALVLGLLLAGTYGLKRWGFWIKKSGQDSRIQVLDKYFLGPRHSLLVVRVREGGLFLIGLSPQGIHFLASLENEKTTSDLSRDFESELRKTRL